VGFVPDQLRVPPAQGGVAGGRSGCVVRV